MYLSKSAFTIGLLTSQISLGWSFAPISPTFDNAKVLSSRNTDRSMVATTPDALVNGNSQVNEPTTWECDDDLQQCVEVPACDEDGCRTTLDVRINGEWYDLSGELSSSLSLFYKNQILVKINSFSRNVSFRSYLYFCYVLNESTCMKYKN